MWLQNEGLYNDFYGTIKPFWMLWRVQPEPYGDKIWGNIEYRADFFKTLSSNAINRVGEDNVNGEYQPDITFDTVRIWNEYQDTGEIKMTWGGAVSEDSYPDIRKKFRIWRADIPRAKATTDNPYGLDRIRNPWIWLKMGVNADKMDNRCMMQLHDVNIKYYTNEQD